MINLTNSSIAGSNRHAGLARRIAGSNTFTRLIVIAALALCVAGSGCKHSQKAMAVPDDLQITIGQGGGFAGRMTGYTIAADGSIVQWEGKYPGENKRGEAPADEKRAATLWSQATEAGLLTSSEQEVGNMTWFVSVTADGESRRASWASWPDTGTTMSEAQEFYRACLEVASAAVNGNAAADR